MSKQINYSITNLLSPKALKNGLHKVNLVVTFCGKKKRWVSSSGISISKEDYLKMKSSKGRCDKLKNYKIDLEKERIKANEICLKLDTDFTFYEFERHFFNKETVLNKQITVKELMEKYINENKQLQENTIGLFNTSVNSINKFKINLTIGDLNVKTLKDFQQSLVEAGLSQSTVGTYLTYLRTIYNYSIKLKRSYKDLNPFDEIKIPKIKQFKRALTNEQLTKLINYKAKNLKEKKSIDMWLFSFYCSGMNYKDILSLKQNNIKDEQFVYVRAKVKNRTNSQKPIHCNIVDKVKVIINDWGNEDKGINDYIFSDLNNKSENRSSLKIIKNALRTTNNHLEPVGKELDFEFKLTTQYARHTYATILRNKGYLEAFIGESMGHSNPTTTAIYFSSFGGEIYKESANYLSSL